MHTAVADDPGLPPSKPLQIFLLVALVITGSAYVADEWAEMTTTPVQARYSNRLRHLVQSQSAFLQHTAAGQEAMGKKRFDQAVSEFRLAVQAQNNAEGHENLGNALLQQGNPDAAFAQFREAARLNPSRASVYTLWGQALVSEGKPEEAVHVYEDGLQCNTNAGDIHYNLAVALQHIEQSAEADRRQARAAGDTQKAEAADAQCKLLTAQALQHYTKASRMGVTSAALWAGYGDLLSQQGKYAEAEAALIRSVTQDPKIAAGHFQLAVAQERLGKYADAIEHYQTVLTLTPNDPETLNHLALLYATAANPDARSSKMAVLLATRASAAASHQNARFMDTLARSYAADGDFFQAISWEEKAVRRATQLGEQDWARQFQGRYDLYVEHKNE